MAKAIMSDVRCCPTLFCCVVDFAINDVPVIKRFSFCIGKRDEVTEEKKGKEKMKIVSFLARRLVHTIN